MYEFKTRGDQIRNQAKTLVLDFMKVTEICHPRREGMKQAEIFRACGLDWGDYPNSSSSNQQYWIVGLLRELESERKVERVSPSGPWRLAEGRIESI